MQPSIIKIATYVALTATLGHLTSAQLTWDPAVSGGTALGGSGTWDTTTGNWWDNVINTTWDNSGTTPANFSGTGSNQIISLDSGLTIGDLNYAGGNILQLKGLVDNQIVTIKSGGATWDTGGGQIEFLSDQSADVLLTMGNDTLTVNGGGEFDTGERPAGANWAVGLSTLDIPTATTLRGNTGTVGQFSTVKLAGGSTYLHERNADQGYANNWELGTGTVSFDNRFVRTYTLNGIVSGDGRLEAINLGGASLVLSADNTFTGGVTVDSTANQSILSITSATDAGLGATPGSFDAVNIILRDGGVLKTSFTDLGVNRGIELDGTGGAIVAQNPLFVKGVISGSGRLSIGLESDASEAQVTFQNSMTYTGGTTVEKGVLFVGADDRFGATPGAVDADNITLRNGAAIRLNAMTLDTNRGITLDGGGAIIANGSISYGGVITGDGGFVLGRSGDGANSIFTPSGDNAYTGGTQIFRGFLVVGADETLPAENVLTIGGAGTSKLVLGGNSQTIGGLTTAGNNTRQVVNQNNNAAASGTAGTLIIDVADGESHTYGSAYGVNSTQNFGNFDTVKNGLGTQQLNNMQTAGDLTVNAGLMIINDANANAAGATSVTGGTLRINNSLTSASYATSGSGILQVGNGGATGNIGGADVANDGTLSFNRTGALSYGGIISGTGGLQVNGGLTMTLTGVNTFTGTVEVLDGTLIVESASALTDYSMIDVAAEEIFLISYEGTDWTSAEVADVGGLSTTINWLDPSAYLGLDISAGSIALEHNASGAHGLWVQGNSADVLTINTSQSYAGNTYIQHGEILLTANDQLPATTVLSLDASSGNVSRLQLNGSNQTIGGLTAVDNGTKELVNNSVTTSTFTFDVAADEVYSYSGNFLAPSTGTFNLVKDGGGTQSIDRNGLSGYTGTATVNAGRLGFRYPAAIDPITQSITVDAGAAFLLEAGNVSEWLMADIDSLLANATFNPGSSLAVKNEVEAFDYTSDITGDIGLIKTGNATLTLSGTNTYTGKTIVEGSLIVIDDEADLGATPAVLTADHLTLDGGGLQAAAALTIDDANRGITLLDGGGLFANNLLEMTVATPITGSGSLTLSGTGGTGTGFLELTGTNTYTGDTILSQGNLKVSSTSNLPDASNLTINGVGILLIDGDLDGSNAADFTRPLGTGPGQVQWTNGGGFAASGADRSVDIGGAGADLTWGLDGFMPPTLPTGFTLFFSSSEATHTTTFVNGVILPQAVNYAVATINGGAEIDAVLSGDISGDGGLRIRLSGTMALEGTNTYNRPTIIEDDGILLVNGDQSGATGAVTATANSILGGSGIIGGAITIDDSAVLAPGASVGTLTAETDVSFSDNSTFAVEIDSSAPSSDLLDVNGGTVTIGTGVSLDILDIAGVPAIVAGGAKLTIIDYTGASLTGTFDGLADGATVTVGSNEFILDYDDGGNFVTLTAQAVSGYSTWASTSGLTGANDGETDDPEFDGIENLLEYILGGDPLAADLSILPTSTINGGNFELSFTRSDDSEADATASVQFGSDLTAFPTVTAVVPDSSSVVSGVTFTITENGAAPDDVTASIPHGGATEFFGRVDGSLAP